MTDSTNFLILVLEFTIYIPGINCCSHFVEVLEKIVYMDRCALLWLVGFAQWFQRFFVRKFCFVISLLHREDEGGREVAIKLNKIKIIIL